MKSTSYNLCKFLVVLMLLSLVGCKSSKKVGMVDAIKMKAHHEFFQSIENQAIHYQTLTARLNVNLLISGKELSSRVDIRMVKDSAFQLSVQPLLGIELFRIELSKDTVKIMDRMNKKYLIENYSNFQGKTPFEFNFYNLQALFTNRLFIPGEKDVQEKNYHRFKLNQDHQYVEIRTKDAMGFLYAFKADGEEKLLSTRICDPLKKQGLQWFYSDFRLVDEQPFPSLMDVNVLKGGKSVGSIRIYYSKIQLNNPLDLSFSIPAKYGRVSIMQVLKMIQNMKR